MDLLREGMRLAREQRVDEALVYLKQGFDKAMAQNDKKNAALVSKSAAVVCFEAGRLREAARHYHDAADLDSRDAYTQWALGDVYSALNEVETAKKHWGLFAELAKASEDPDLLEFLERHTAHKPDDREGPE